MNIQHLSAPSQHSTSPRRLLSLLCGTVCIASLFMASAAQASSPIVVQTEDATHTSLCTLRDAVATANLGTANTGTPPGVGNCTWDGEATIQLEDGKTYLLNAQLPVITTDMTIKGETVSTLATITRSPGSASRRLMKVGSGARLELKSLVLSYGYANKGGAIKVKSGGQLSATTVHFLDNEASSQGGAIYNRGDVELLNCTFAGNTADKGGALFNSDDGIINIDQSLLESNTASYGGAIYQEGQQIYQDQQIYIYIERSTLSANQAYVGGALFNKSGRSRIYQSTLRNNDASDAGSAVFAEWGLVELGKSAFTAEATQASLCYGSQYVKSLGDNALSDASCGIADPVVGPIAMSELVDHGGVTRLHAPLCDWSSGSCDSPLIDQYACPANERDQRDQFARAPAGQFPLGGALCDIGAYESVCDTGNSTPGHYTITIYESQIPTQHGNVILNNGSCASSDVDFEGQQSLCAIRWNVYGGTLKIRDLLFLEDTCTYPSSQPIDCFANPEDCRDHCLLAGTGLPPYPLTDGGPRVSPDTSYTLQAPTCTVPNSVRYLIEFEGGELKLWDPELGAESGGGTGN